MKRLLSSAPLRALIVGIVIALGLLPAFAEPSLQQAGFGYGRVTLPLLANRAPAPTPPPANPAKVVAWLETPGSVPINQQLQVSVVIQNQGSSFNGRTEVVVPYNGQKFKAVNSSFTSSRGDWVRQNNWPTDLTVEFGPLASGEQRRGVLFFDLRAGQAGGSVVGDSLYIRARQNNGQNVCGQSECQMNARYVQVLAASAPLPPPPVQVIRSKIGEFNEGQLVTWQAGGYRPGERVVTWLTSPNSFTPATYELSGAANSVGNIQFSFPTAGLRNGFYAIIYHGMDTNLENSGEFQILNSPLGAVEGLPPVFVSTVAAPPADLAAAPAQLTGSASLSGVVAAGGTNGAARLAGVHVTLLDADGATVATAYTDSFGGYRLSRLPAGAFSVRFDPQYSLDDNARRFQSQQVAAATLADSEEILNAELTPGSTISGLVSGEGAGSLEGVSVLLLAGDTLVEAAVTGADGRYELSGVPSGSYTLLVDPSTASEAGQAFAALEGAAFSVSAPTPSGGRNLTLPRRGDIAQIEGQVVAADSGQPLGDVFVIIERFDEEAGGFRYADLARTGGDGSYLSVVTPGRYRIRFAPGLGEDPNSARYLGEYFDDQNASARAMELDLTAGGAIGQADASLAPIEP